MNRIRPTFRNPLIRRIWRHRTVATMLRSELSNADIRPRVQFTSQPLVFRYPEEKSLVDTTDLPMPGDELYEAMQENLPSEETPIIGSKQRPETSPAISTNESTNRPFSISKSDQESPPVVTNLPAKPVVQAKTQEKAKPGWRLPAVIRKWQERRKVEKISQVPSVDDKGQSNVITSSPHPILERKPEIQAPSALPRVQAIPGEIVGRSLEFEQPMIMEQPPTPSTPLARAVVPTLPVQPTDKEATSTRRVVSEQERIQQQPSVVSPVKTEEELHWRRLQTILRKHEEKRAAKEIPPSQNPPSAEEGKSYSQTSPESISAKPSSNLPAQNQTSKTTILRSPQPSEKKSPSVVEVPSSSTTQAVQIPPKRSTNSKEYSKISNGEGDATQPETPVVDRSIHPPLTPSTTGNGLQPPSIQDTEYFPQLTAEPESEATQMMPLPLESVWPVQRKETFPISTKPAPAPSPSEPSLSNSAPLSSEEEDRLRQAVQKTKTGQPTDSSVEVILPRSPRPPSIPKAVSPIPPKTPSHFEEQSSSTAGESENLPTSSPPTGDYPAASGEPQGNDQVTTSLPSIQRADIANRKVSTTPQDVTDTPASSASQIEPPLQAAPESQTSSTPSQASPISKAVPAPQISSASQTGSVSQAVPEPQSSSSPQAVPEPQSSSSSQAVPEPQSSSSSQAVPEPQSSSSPQAAPVSQAVPTPQTSSISRATLSSQSLPSPQARSTSPRTSSASETTFISHDTPVLQAKPVPQAKPVSETVPEKYVASAAKIESTSQSTPVIQAQPAPPPAVPLIPTEIGSLPSDLWQLIGQTPPEPPVARIIPEATPSETKVQTIIPETHHPASPELSLKPVTESADYHYVSEPPAAQAIPATASVSKPVSVMPTYLSEDTSQVLLQEIANAEKPGKPPLSEVHPPQAVIQRQDVEDQATTPESPTPSGGEESPQKAPAFSEEELDKLARQVYEEIRQKIFIERERTRGWIS